MNNLSSLKSAFPAWLLLMTLCLISFIAFWPGIMSADATSQYLAAKAGVYSDHHPPLMSLVWRYLDFIYPGPGLLFTMHMLMLYTAAAIFVYLFRDSKFKWWYAIYPVIPNMLAYTALIVKDTGFTYSYLLSGAILAFMMLHKTAKHKYVLLSLVLLLLFYGSAVKFQAKYLLVFFCIAVTFCVFTYRLQWRTIITGVLVYLAMLFGIESLNATLVPKAQESHSWQLVKLYDLSAISLALNEPLFPNFVKYNPKFYFAKVQQQFKEHQVDHLVFYDYSTLQPGVTAQQREELWDYWWNTVKSHPWLYLKIRCKLFKHNLVSSPSEYNNPVDFFKTTALAPLIAKPWVNYLLELGFNIFKIALRFMWLLPLLIVYCCVAIIKFKQVRAAAPLLLFASTSLALMAILLFCSMAGTARYVFLATCLVHASHGFAFRVLQVLVKQGYSTKKIAATAVQFQ